MFATHYVLILSALLYTAVAVDQAWRGEINGATLYACYALSNIPLFRMLG